MAWVNASLSIVCPWWLRLGTALACTPGTGSASRWVSPSPAAADALLAETVSTGGDDWVPQYLLTHSTPGLILGQRTPWERGRGRVDRGIEQEREGESEREIGRKRKKRVKKR